ncbi:putative serine protease K12H4.7 [Belonocnema kinseyi]|uniref:putative serine protease K12H4.7 n=1 Tax=Belonocnema kinseyi TaxID=2817044 RepID=UPI00143CD10E|nr:putative serine protease K12H4.7 [Belonocnema kinseyi]
MAFQAKHRSTIQCIGNFGFYDFNYDGIIRHGPNRTEKNVPIKEKWITQPLDHFHLYSREWKMRYLENDNYFNGSGPIFIMLGGEWQIGEHYLQSGLIHDIGFEHGALMYKTEHRFYGKSIVSQYTGVEFLKFLNVDQALADVAYFIEFIKEEKNLRDRSVIVFGCSYAGNMAVWMRLKYPHLVQAAYATGAPVLAKGNFFEYMEVVTASYKKHSEECVTEIAKAIKSLEEMLLTEKGLTAIKEQFNFCILPDTSTISGYGTLIKILTNKIVGAVQKNNVSYVCQMMTDKSLKTSLQRLAQLNRESEDCIRANYTILVCLMRYEPWHPIISSQRQWLFQTCTEYGYYPTTDSDNSMFGAFNVTLEYHTKHCRDVFGKEYNEHFLSRGIKRTNLMYGGKKPDVRNVLFVNGNRDPWHVLSVLEDLNDSSPSILIDGSSHCTDLGNFQFSDSLNLLFARYRIRQIVGKWIQSGYGEFIDPDLKAVRAET